MIFTGSGPTISNPNPAVASGSLAQGSLDTGVATEYTITYTTMNPMDDYCSFLIDYPEIITISQLSLCQITYGPTRLLALMKCTVGAGRTI